MAHKLGSALILHKEHFEDFFERLISNYIIYGPSRDGHEKAVCRIKKLSELDIDHKNAKMSPKQHFFPQTETMFSFDAVTRELLTAKKQEAVSEKQHILFSARPCDAMAISLMDQVFIEKNIQDPYYVQRRTKTLIFSFACLEPGSACFCRSVGCSPDSETGADLMFYDLKDRYYIRKVTKQGVEALTNVGMKVSAATEKDREEKEDLMDRAKETLEKGFDAAVLSKKLEDFGADIWENLHQKCLGCGICTYFCPTCHCFDITDEVVKTQGQRVRTWDSCMFPLFTLHASGHNPRPTTKQRMRQRLMHKFNYALKNTGQIFCVGCGRCIIHCPVNLDVRMVLKEIAGEE